MFHRLLGTRASIIHTKKQIFLTKWIHTKPLLCTSQIIVRTFACFDTLMLHNGSGILVRNHNRDFIWSHKLGTHLHVKQTIIHWVQFTFTILHRIYTTHTMMRRTSIRPSTKYARELIMATMFCLYAPRRTLCGHYSVSQLAVPMHSYLPTLCMSRAHDSNETMTGAYAREQTHANATKWRIDFPSHLLFRTRLEIKHIQITNRITGF